jgi:hypothetical protein
MANVFISHRKTDDLKAEELAKEISLAGHEVWLDVWDIDLGDSIVGKMNEGLGKADYVVVCYSESGVESTWMSREWMSALARQLEGLSVKLLPVILTGGTPPALLADVVYVDLSTDWFDGITRLLRSIK